EIGHAVGLWHEQSRNDRDRFIRINWGNIQSGLSSNFNTSGSAGIDFGTFDFESIMLYGSYAFSANGMPTMTRLDGTTFVGMRTGLSTGDRATIDWLYGGGDVWVSTAAGSAFYGNGWGTKWHDWFCIGSQVCATGD